MPRNSYSFVGIIQDGPDVVSVIFIIIYSNNFSSIVI